MAGKAVAGNEVAGHGRTPDGRGLLLDIGGVVVETGIHLVARLAEREPAIRPLLDRIGGLGSERDELWQRMLRREVTDQAYWAQRAAEVGAALGETWDTRAMMDRLYALPREEWLRADVVRLMADTRAAGLPLAVAHIRGGGEGGRRWWLQGRLDRKRNTFTDFIAAADALAAQGWAAPDRIVSRGRSAGGLLQGAVFTMAPRRWRAVVAEVPFVDCVTTMSDPTIPLTINEWDEWGNPRDDPVMRAYLLSYSPYDNMPPLPWPDLLVTGNVHDTRVLIKEPARWVARLRATAGASAGADGPAGRLLFRAELGTEAHMGPTGRYDKLRYEAEILAFIVTATGMPAAPGG